MEQVGIPLAVSVPEGARMIGLSKSRMYELIAEGRVEARKIGSRTVIPTASLRALLDAAPAMKAA